MMQSETSLTWLGWKQFALAIIASLVTGGGIVSLVNTWLNRRKPAAETAEITIRARVTEGDAVTRWMNRLEDAQASIDRLRSERDSWQDEYDKMFVERDDLIKRNAMLTSETASYLMQMKQMKATLELKNLNYDGTQGIKVTDDSG